MRTSLFHKFDSVRAITFSYTRFSDNTEEESIIKEKENNVSKKLQPIISVETSIKYMDSDAYKQTYGDNPVWKLYKRNHKGLFAPRKTRKTCIRQGIISTGNPCPICKDEYLILDHRNVKLLKQFINKYNGETLSYSKTGICQKKYKELLIALTRAKDYGTITFDVPRRKYDYSEWKSANN
ncbi:hypothetical protein HN011_002525 [Eciton burchellii]|nr:hypothetical protein HN011_002525 [Eciton burchellii]